MMLRAAIENRASTDLEKVETINKLPADRGSLMGGEKNCHKTNKNRRSFEADQRGTVRRRLAGRNTQKKKKNQDFKSDI